MYLDSSRKAGTQRQGMGGAYSLVAGGRGAQSAQEVRGGDCIVPSEVGNGDGTWQTLLRAEIVSSPKAAKRMGLEDL